MFPEICRPAKSPLRSGVEFDKLGGMNDNRSCRPRPPRRAGRRVAFPIRRLLGAITALGLAPLALGAEPAPISTAEALQPPTAGRLAAILAGAQREGWAAQTRPLRVASVSAYEHDRLAAAEAWFHLGRWAGLFSEPADQFQARWTAAMRTAKVAIPAMPSRGVGRGSTLGAAITPELQAWLVGHADFSVEFFAMLSPVDYVPHVLRILDEIHFRDPARFSSYASLALALAVVYDVPPPPGWPHQQVTVAALPRRFPPATEAFAWWTRQDELGRTYQKLTQLDAGELKFVIDTAAPLRELEWSQEMTDYPLRLLARTYSFVRYREDRVAKNELMWPGDTYRLVDILGQGGICVDQAYFAAEAGKARGVPTLLFRGEGSGGRHAWFGFLDGEQQWQLDAGRFAELRLATGIAYDPQTWSELSDHELKFLSERFRERPAFRRSRVHAEFARAFLLAADTAASMAAARRAVDAEPRNQAAWETLLAAGQAAGRGAPELEGVLREAARSFERYPDLEALYANRLAASRRARGETAAAEAGERDIARKNQGGRTDLSVQQVRARLLRAVGSQSVAEQIHIYDSAVDALGRAGGIVFFDQVVVGFAEHLRAVHEPAEAVRAVERARRTLEVPPGSQLEQDFARLLDELKAAK